MDLELLGADWTDFAKGAAGILSAAGGAMTGQPTQQQAQQLALQKQAEEMRRAEESAKGVKMVVLAIVGVFVVLAGGGLIVWKLLQRGGRR